MKPREKINHKNSDFILVITTTSELAEAKKIAEFLVNKKAAACVSISSKVLSIYKWKGKAEMEEEFMLFIKTIRDNYSLVESIIQEIHSYEVPEIMAIPIEFAEKDYSLWLKQNSMLENHPI
jgi:periplasmic divalent cation tolerance protein